MNRYFLMILCVVLWGCDLRKSDVKYIKLTHNLSVSHPFHNTLQMFAKEVAQKSYGKIEVTIFPNSVLGPDRTVMEQLQGGVVEMMKIGSSGLEPFDPVFSVFSLPYLFDSEEQFHKVLRGELIDKINKRTAKRDHFIILTYFPTGVRSFYTRNTPIEKPEDLQGLKIRVRRCIVFIYKNLKYGFFSKTYGFLFGISWNGGLGAFVDFTNPRAREIWKSLLKKHLLELGADSLWNDNCEYEINDARAQGDFDGKKQSMMALKSVEPLLMAQVAYEAISEVYPQRRPFVINRAGYAGFQRYASSWCGDNYTSWKSLRYNMTTILGMGLCGVANYGADIGGFAGPRPAAELLVRWIQNGIFQPRFCIHSCNSDNTVTQPWMYSDYTSVIEKAMTLRRELLPYMYSLLYHAHVTGEPIVRPLVYEFQEDENTYENHSTLSQQ